MAADSLIILYFPVSGTVLVGHDPTAGPALEIETGGDGEAEMRTSLRAASQRAWRLSRTPQKKKCMWNDMMHDGLFEPYLFDGISLLGDGHWPSEVT